MLSPELRTQRARKAALSLHRQPDDPELVTVSRSFAVSRLEEHIRSVVAAAPPLSPTQRARLRDVLSGGGPDA